MKGVAVIGLGTMGHGIADNFLKNGYKVFVWNRSKEKADDLVKRGATLTTSPKEATEKADLVFEVTANNESSREVWTGDEGILKSTDTTKSLITCATLSVKWMDELAKICQDKGYSFFDMPMTGGRIGAETGELILLVGGHKDKLDSISDDLKAISKEVKYFGPAGSGMRYKLVLNMLQAIHIAGLGEALKLANTAGLNEQLAGDALADRPGGITTGLAWRDYQTEPDPINFSVEWIEKDLKYAKEMAAGADLPLLDQALSQYEEAIKKGFAQSDWTKINKL